jgi:pimeloyl-ACP methyl ester carboxylesterase
MDLILLPGMDGTGVFFERFIECLGEDIDPVVVSYPEDEPLGYEDLLPLVTSCFPKEKPFVILGESFSGPLAAMAGAEARKNLRGVIMVASFVRSPMPRSINWLKGLLRVPVVAMRPNPLILLRIFCPGTDPGLRRWFKEKLPRLPAEVIAARARAVLEVNSYQDLRKCGVPVLYLAASRDRVVRRKALDAVWLCRPDVKVKVLDGPHVILQTKPAEAARVIEEFCKSLNRE